MATGDKILLGEGGPELLVETLVLPSVPRAVGRDEGAAAKVVLKTAEVLEARQRQALRAQQAVADSIRREAELEYERLRAELEAARAASASPAVLDSLKAALNGASNRTAALEAALHRAEEALRVQLAAGDSLRRQAQTELERLRGELARAGSSNVSAGLLDSLRGAVQAAEERAHNIEAQMRAIRGMNLAAVSQANQGAVGLITVAVALDETKTVRTGMSGGIFSKVTESEIRFDGFTVPGSSGSPSFNAAGEVVAVHRAGLREAAGLSFAVPVKFVLPLLPPEARAELGLR